MEILVTGATGFLGTHLCNTLRQAGHSITEISSKNCDLKNPNGLFSFSKKKYDRIFHLAAWTQAGEFCLTHAGEQWIINQQINTNVLNWWKSEQPQAKLVAIGSSCCYEPGQPHVEENFLRGLPIESLFTYAMTKRMLFTGLMALQMQFGLKYLFVVPSTLYGPNYHLDGRQMHFIFDLMRKIVDGRTKDAPVVLWGDGSQRRELIHVRDFISAMLQLDAKVENEIVNIGGGVEHPIREFAELLSKIVGYDSKKIQYDTSRYVGAKSKFLVVDKLKKILPNFQQQSLENGLQEIVDWYRKAVLQ